MFRPFFAVAVLSPDRQRSFRVAATSHLGLLLACTAWACSHPQTAAPVVGYVLLTAGIMEGAVLLGWRLTQLPKAQSLEFLLASPLRPAGVLVAEVLVGLCRLALVTLSGLPVLLLLAVNGILTLPDLALLLVMPWTWGAVTGLGLVTWVYEPLHVRRWIERGALGLIVTYLVVGFTAGEHLVGWINALPEGLAALCRDGVMFLHRDNPFSLLHTWLLGDWDACWRTLLALEAVAVAAALALLARAAHRLRGHFHDYHYRPAADESSERRESPGDHPLAWWAVRRVTAYSGGFNLWLAAGFGIAYALYTVLGPHWPAWMGQRVFRLVEVTGGIASWATALVLLAAVPAAFQYGLWDSSKQERCRRLELLLLTPLTGADYWRAAGAAAWRRGRGYFAVAALLWVAQACSTPGGAAGAVAGMAAGVLLWGLYFAVGFWAFSRGIQANTLGLGLSIGLPVLTICLHRLGWKPLAGLLPPGCVFAAGGLNPDFSWLIGALVCALFMLPIARRARAECEGQLRNWYGTHQGAMVLD
jgi:hypothetical protein